MRTHVWAMAAALAAAGTSAGAASKPPAPTTSHDYAAQVRGELDRIAGRIDRLEVAARRDGVQARQRFAADARILSEKEAVVIRELKRFETASAGARESLRLRVDAAVRDLRGAHMRAAAKVKTTP